MRPIKTPGNKTASRRTRQENAAYCPPEGQGRDLRLDFLRIIATFAVVWLHVSAEVVVTNPGLRNVEWWYGNVADSLSRWCVPVFVMISGGLLLSQPDKPKLFEFYRHRAAKVLPPLLFWTVFYIGFRTYFQTPLDIVAVATSLVRGKPYYHLWYLYMVIGLYVFTPFLRQLVAASRPQLLNAFIVVCFLLASVEAVLTALKDTEPASFLGMFPPFVAYFVSGFAMRIRPVTVSLCAAFTSVMGCTALISLGTGFLFPVLGPKSWKVMYSYLNPFVIVMSLVIYQFVVGFRASFEVGTNNNSNGWVQNLSAITLGIYCIHPFWIAILDRWGLNAASVHPALGIPLLSLSAFALSAGSAALLSLIPYVRAAVK